MQEATTQILLYRLLFPVIASPPIAQMAQCEAGRPPGGLTTKLRGIIPDGTNRKAPHLCEALNFWWLHLKASIDPVCDVYLFPHHLNEGINPSLESRLNKNRHFVKCNFLDKSYFIENIHYRVTLFNIWFAYSSCLMHSPTRLSKKSL
ncbi:hypothetical protein DPP32_24520 [Salmonella enterica subsp. enterica serovar Kimberley]|nr:hypothetical protein [Salmonella enterica subsp. enterica serovar Kimberley]